MDKLLPYFNKVNELRESARLLHKRNLMDDVDVAKSAANYIEMLEEMAGVAETQRLRRERVKGKNNGSN
jgi:hypothetical protein